MRTGPGLTAGSRRVRGRAAGLVLVAVALVAGCDDDGPSAATTSSTASPALINGGGPVLDEATIDGRVEAAAKGGDDSAAATCAVVLDWTYELVGTVNGFTTTSRTLTSADAEERRTAYLDVFDGALRLTHELERALEEIADADPQAEPASALVIAAAGRAEAELEGARAAATELPDTAYELRRVEGGKLFVASEKARSLVFSGLDQAGTELGISGLLAPCGRPQYPDT
jgi:hypothetical protein